MQVRVLPLILLLVHCSTAAKITLNDQREIHAKILDSTKEEIRLMTDAEAATVSRATIKDISHPGKYHMLLGFSLIAASTIFFITVDQRECRDSCAQPVTGLALPVIGAAAGAGMFFWGYSAWSESRSAAMPQQLAATGSRAHFGIQYHF